MPELAFWVEGGAPAGLRLIDLCDVLYTLHLIGRGSDVTARAKRDFVRVFGRKQAPGRFTRGGDERLNPHLTAYALGVLNLLKIDANVLADEFFRGEPWNIGELFDEQTGLPRWPSHLSHHTWRVSHWIGGALSIVHSLWTLAAPLAQKNKLPALAPLLTRCDSIVDGDTGMLRAYKSPLLQNVFRAVYKTRHDPDAADIGGTVHLHWINYAADRRPYKACQALHERAWKILQRTPFIESVPYCLDFDIIQIVRTSLPNDPNRTAALRVRALRLMDDITRFYAGRLDAAYALHKVPGSLAALHECAFAAGAPMVPGLGIPPIDIIKEAHWL